VKAVYIKDHGDAGRLIYGDRATPKPGAGEALVRVKACGVNHLDLWVRQGMPGLTVPFPHVLGCDAAGTIEKLGTPVPHLSVGQKVFVIPGLSCGSCEACLTGQDHLCAHFDILGQVHDGTYADYVCVPVENVVPLPEQASFEEAAAFPLVYMTAWAALVTRAQIGAGDRVLIHAAGSGLGVAAIQIAQLWGAQVIATVGSEEKVSKARKLGVERIINHQKKDVVHEVRQMTDKKGVTVLLDHVGAATFEKSLACMARGGRMIVCGTTTGGDVKMNLRSLFSRNVTLHGVRMGAKQDFMQAARFFGKGALRPVIDSVFPLKKASEAHAHMEGRKNFGKIILTV